MIEDLKPGDLVAVCGKSPTSLMIQAATLSLPNLGPLGRWGLAGISHVGILSPIFGDLYVYESTSFGRPPCVRTGRENPVGVQVHPLSTILDAGGDVFVYPLKRALYEHEVDRLWEALESCLGRDYDYFGAGKSWGGLVRWAARRIVPKENLATLFCSELVAYAWSQVGLLQSSNAGAWNPSRLCRYAVRKGICHKGRLLS